MNENQKPEPTKKRGPKPQDKALKAFETVTVALSNIDEESRPRIIRMAMIYLGIDASELTEGKGVA